MSFPIPTAMKKKYFQSSDWETSKTLKAVIENFSNNYTVPSKWANQKPLILFMYRDVWAPGHLIKQFIDRSLTLEF